MMKAYEYTAVGNYLREGLTSKDDAVGAEYAVAPTHTPRLR
jgi:hypothetical protein